jgi:outer membrane lipoprotein SlyB
MIIKALKMLFVTVLIGATVAGCAPSISPDVYGPCTTCGVSQTIPGVIYSARPVKVQGTPGVAGAIAGGVVGAIAGSAIGGGRGCLLGAVGGTVAGAGLGGLVEQRLTRQWGMEYVVQTESGSLMTVVQGCSQYQFQCGQHVLVIMGPQPKVIPDPNY